MKPTESAKLEEALELLTTAFEAYNHNQLAAGNRDLNEACAILEALQK